MSVRNAWLLSPVALLLIQFSCSEKKSDEGTPAPAATDKKGAENDTKDPVAPATGADSKDTAVKSPYDDFEDKSPEAKRAAVDIEPPADSPKGQRIAVSGTIRFTMKDDQLSIRGMLRGLPPRSPEAGEDSQPVMSLSIHESGDCQPGSTSEPRLHFNPTGVAHGSFKSESHHAGDLPHYAVTEDGTIEINIDMNKLTLSLEDGAANNLVGHTVALNYGADDGATQPTGAVGRLVGCGVIKLKP